MKLKNYQKIIIVLILIVLFGLMYEELFHLLIEFLHLAFESLEYMLDLIIEHLFETGTHETQVIVFYILTPVAIIALYLFFRVFIYAYGWFKTLLQQQKAETLKHWQALSILKKIGWCFVLVMLVSGGVFLFF